MSISLIAYVTMLAWAIVWAIYLVAGWEEQTHRDQYTDLGETDYIETDGQEQSWD